MRHSDNSCLFPALSVLLVTFALVIVHSVRRRNKQYRLSYPPGPPTWLGIKNLLYVPKGPKHIEYARWSQKYHSTSLIVILPGRLLFDTALRYAIRRRRFVLCSRFPDSRRQLREGRQGHFRAALFHLFRPPTLRDVIPVCIHGLLR